jgi:diguanylate cyclase (GGDEF)-like protein
MFISLKIKALILTSILVLGLSAFFAFVGETQLENLYKVQRDENHRRHKDEITALIQQSNNHLLQLVDIIPTLSMTNEYKNNVQSSLNNHWEYLAINWSLDSAHLYRRDGSNIAHWGSKNNFNKFLTDIEKTGINGTPLSIIDCHQQCLQILITPVINHNKDFQVLLLTRSISDILSTFNNLTQSDIGVLSRIKSNSKKSKNLDIWQRRAATITNFKDTLPLLQDASEKISFNQLINASQSVELNSGSFQLALIPTEPGQDYSYYIIIENVTEERSQIADASSSYIVTAISAVIIFSLLIIIMLWKPIVRLRQQADLMPLLSQGKFAYVREILAQSNRKRWFKDEIDILDSSEINVSLQLESMQEQIQNHNKELQKLVLFDTLTGLATRRSLLDEIQICLNKENSSFSLLFLDLDNFKRINDSLGHHCGDELLKIVGKRLQSCVRGGDLVSRLGGDEFCILIREIRHQGDGSIIANNVLNVLRNPLRLQSTEVIVSASIGIVSSPEDGLNTEELLQKADLAMYRAKALGRNKYQLFNNSMTEHAVAQLELENELRQALINREFVLYYQPQIDFKNNTICSVEALVRWRHPVRGLLAPGQFIAQLEETGLIVPLGEWVLVEACEALRRWLDAGLEPIKMSVNLSSRQFQDPKLFPMIEQTLSLTQVPAKLLELEITESMVIQDIENNNRALHQLQQLGMSIAIDDFGTGYSSFSYLKELPLDTLKIDRSFVMDIPDNETDMEITAAIIAVAHKLKLKVVAEGIETSAQEKFLIAEGCDIGQGYLFSKPIAEPDLVALLKKENKETTSANDE